MTWTSKGKDLSLHTATPHTNSVAGLIGRAPGFSTINFGPLDLYGAAARCSHLHVISPSVATPESYLVRSLIEQHVDDVSSDFAILPTAANFKDFVKSYFAGTVASGLAYLAMIDDGYVWSDHFENVGGGNPAVTKSPDYVFTGPATGTALVESKGTRGASLAAFNRTVDAGYVTQVEPHLGYTVGGVTATHGYCVGGWLTSTTKAELLVHHTGSAGSVGTGVGGQSATGSQTPTAPIQRQNYATAFLLAHSQRLGQQLRETTAERFNVPFFRVKWRGLTWLTGFPLSRWQWWLDEEIWFPHSPTDQPPFFAVEEKIATSVLSSFFSYNSTDESLDIQPLSRDFRNALMRGEGPQVGAAFPDGLAVIRSDYKLIGQTSWDPKRRIFE